jgi:hypothetical protein
VDRERPFEADALKIAQEFKDSSAHTYVDFYWSGVIYAGLGDKDEAFRLPQKLSGACRYPALSGSGPVLVRNALRPALRRSAEPNRAATTSMIGGLRIMKRTGRGFLTTPPQAHENNGMGIGTLRKLLSRSACQLPCGFAQP